MIENTLAQKIAEDITFGTQARWIHRKQAKKNTHSYFNKSFFLNKKPGKAILLAMSTKIASQDIGYTEIYLNGRLAVLLTERSYMFDRAYEAFDVAEYLIVGENLVDVLYIEAGEEAVTGFALELQTDQKTILVSDSSWMCRQDMSVNEGMDYSIYAAVEERVDQKSDDGIAILEPERWEFCEVLGNELIHAPLERFHQSKIKEQTFTPCYASSLTAVLLAVEKDGISVKLAAIGDGIQCVMSILKLNKASEVNFVTHSVREISLNGQTVEKNLRYKLEVGEHFLVIAFCDCLELTIRSEAELELFSPIEGTESFAGILLPTEMVKYPWNEQVDNSETDQIVANLLKIQNVDELPEAIRNHLIDISVTNPNSVLHHLISLQYLLPANGKAEERLYANLDIQACDDRFSWIGEEKLFRAEGETILYPQKEEQRFILDFGTERVGQLELDLDAPEGTVLHFHAFEMLTDNGLKYMPPMNTLEYCCREGRQHFLSRRRRGFRYVLVSVSGHDRPVSINYIRVRETRYPAEPYGFSCSDEELNRIYEMCIRTAQVCMLDLYVDCPGYEQNPWTGDARVTALVNHLNFGATDFDAQYLKLIAQSVEDGVYRLHRMGHPMYEKSLHLPCACFPTYPEGCIPVWSFMWLLQVCDYYEFTGNIGLIQDVFYAIRATFERCERMTNDRGLFDMPGAWNLIEWSNNDLSFYGEVTANNVMLSYCLKKWSHLARLLNEDELSRHYQEQSERYREAVNRYCWSDQKRAYVDTVRDKYAFEHYVNYMQEQGKENLSWEEFRVQERISVQSNTMAILYDCVPEERLESASRFLLDNIRSGLYIAGTPALRSIGEPDEEEAPGGYVHIGSPFFMFFALETLYKLGYDDLALLSQRREWGRMLDCGLLTCLEAFPNGRDWSRSVAHGWSSAPAVFLMRDVLGVKPLKPGYQEFAVVPKASDLTSACGTVPTPYGLIHVSWKKTQCGNLEITCDAPKECVRRDIARH